MNQDPSSLSDRFIETCARVAGRLGGSEIRVRWKLRNARQRLHEWRQRQGQRVTHVRYEHASCPRCRGIQSRGARTCVYCGAAMGPHFLEVARRLGFALPASFAATSALVALILAAFTLEVARSHSLLSFAGAVSLRLGANVGPLSLGPQPWRLVTGLLLHGGIIHLVFNLLALTQVGPAIEQIHGRGVALALFLSTGVAASAGSALNGPPHLSVGASGAIMGLVGVAAAWGHRDATSVGISIRNQMLQWALYTLMFGLLVRGIDNVAHVAGFASGAVAGWFVPPYGLRQRHPPAAVAVAGVVSLLVLVAALGLIAFPPPVPMLEQ